MWKEILFSSLLLLILPAGRSAAAIDHLEPVAGSFNNLTLLDSYNSDVKEILLKGAPENPMARMIVLPAFGPEAAVSVEGEPDEEYRVVYRACARPIWDNDDWQEVGVDMRERAIDVETASVVVEVFSLAVRQVHYPVETPFRMYGVTYYFSSGSMAGVTWSPEEASLPGQLVAYGALMVRYAQADDADAQLIRELLISQGWELIEALDRLAQN